MAGAKDSMGTVGVWTGSFQWPEDPGEIAEAAADLEELGFGSAWVGLSAGDLALHEAILAGTRQLVAASGIINVWTEDAAAVASSYHRVTQAYPDRFLLGLGPSHAPFVEAAGQTYTRPLSKVRAYLDELDALDPPVPVSGRVLAALGPKALALAAERSAGAHPYLVTPEHTVDARATIGPGKLLVTEQKVFVGTDPTEARAAGRRSLAIYLDLPNYVNNLLRYGFEESDFANGGSDRLVDSLVAWGDGEAVARRVKEHLDAGADHVLLQVLSASGQGSLPRTEWRSAAEAVL